MFTKFLFWSVGVLTTLLCVLTMYAFINGASCHYSVSLHVPDDERDVFMTCYRGKVVALQSIQDEQGVFLSKWKVEARHLRIGAQSIYFIYSREPIVEDSKADPNERFNQISSGYRFLFYHMERQDSQVYIFQAFPRFYVHRGAIDGYLDIWDKREMTR